MADELDVLRVLTVIGTRPEAIKMAPLLVALEQDRRIKSALCSTGQHREMFDQVMNTFGLRADFDLNIMKPRQDLFDVTSKILIGLKPILESYEPDLVLVHGDTTTCLAAGLATFYKGIVLGHVEAGLRTYDLRAPFPEEANRSLISRIASMHFAPTQKARLNLIREGVPDHLVHVCGNTVVDALRIASTIVDQKPRHEWVEAIGKTASQVFLSGQKRILVTGHRRENFGEGFKRICRALRNIAAEHPDWSIIYPVHLNPNVQEPVNEMLATSANIALVDPIEYLPFIWLMKQCDLILTDSGGVQEEAPSLNVPVLVMRETTERPEAIEAGTAELVGTDERAIARRVEEYLQNDSLSHRMTLKENPYGDGYASERIVEALLKLKLR